jgi:hypothetical protein
MGDDKQTVQGNSPAPAPPQPSRPDPSISEKRGATGVLPRRPLPHT